jgi:hypothetical protein
MIYLIGAVVCAVILVLIKAYRDETHTDWDE